MLFGENILYLAYFDNADIDLNKIKEIKSKGLELVNHKPFISVVNFKNIYGSINNEAKKFVANDEELNRLKIIEILYVNSIGIRLLTKGYLSFFKPKTPTKVIGSFKEIETILKDINYDKPGLIELNSYLEN